MNIYEKNAKWSGSELSEKKNGFFPFCLNICFGLVEKEMDGLQLNLDTDSLQLEFIYSVLLIPVRHSSGMFSDIKESEVASKSKL